MRSGPRTLLSLLALTILFLGAEISARSQAAAHETCPRPIAGSKASQPQDLRAEHGELKLTLRFRTTLDAQGRVRYCYIAKDGAESPTLRVSPGDTLILRLENDIAPELPSGPRSSVPANANVHAHENAAKFLLASQNDGVLHKSSLPRLDDSARLSPGRRPPHRGRPLHCAVRIPIPDS